LQDLCSDLRFVTATRSGGEAERALFMGLWQEREDHGLRLLIGRVAELVAAED
jgi:hypothetical protein